MEDLLIMLIEKLAPELLADVEAALGKTAEVPQSPPAPAKAPRPPDPAAVVAAARALQARRLAQRSAKKEATSL